MPLPEAKPAHDFIIRACNAHDGLMTALTDLCDAWDTKAGGKFKGNVTNAHKAARAAISRALGATETK